MMFKKIFLLSLCVIAATASTFAADLLEKSFRNSVSNQHVINMGNTKESVGNLIFRGGATIDIMGGGITAQEPRIVQLTKFLLRMTIVLSITFILYNGVRYILSGAKITDESNVRTRLINIIAGLIIALLSVALIYLVQSLTISSITSDPKPLPDQGVSSSIPKLPGSNGTGTGG